jgi:hypothetical protein
MGFAAILATLSLAAAPVQAQTRPPIMVRAEQCLRQNVDHVVAAERDLQAAASFLVTYACAAEVSGASRYQRNSAYLQMFSTMFKAIPQGAAVAGKPPPPNMEIKASVDPESGEIVVPPSPPGSPPNPMSLALPMMTNIFGQVAPEAVPVDLRKLAGELVMTARERQPGSRR